MTSEIESNALTVATIIVALLATVVIIWTIALQRKTRELVVQSLSICEIKDATEWHAPIASDTAHVGGAAMRTETRTISGSPDLARMQLLLASKEPVNITKGSVLPFKPVKHDESLRKSGDLSKSASNQTSASARARSRG